MGMVSTRCLQLLLLLSSMVERRGCALKRVAVKIFSERGGGVSRIPMPKIPICGAIFGAWLIRARHIVIFNRVNGRQAASWELFYVMWPTRRSGMSDDRRGIGNMGQVNIIRRIQVLALDLWAGREFPAFPR